MMSFRRRIATDELYELEHEGTLISRAWFVGTTGRHGYQETQHLLPTDSGHPSDILDLEVRDIQTDNFTLSLSGEIGGQIEQLSYMALLVRAQHRNSVAKCSFQLINIDPPVRPKVRLRLHLGGASSIPFADRAAGCARECSRRRASACVRRRRRRSIRAHSPSRSSAGRRPSTTTSPSTDSITSPPGVTPLSRRLFTNTIPLPTGNASAIRRDYALHGPGGRKKAPIRERGKQATAFPWIWTITTTIPASQRASSGRIARRA
jgi:hypothetical protein